jgi:Ni/Co efflux regulator RcnB
MKKLIVGLMGFLLVGAMALPVAAQGRRSDRDNQATNVRKDNAQRNDFGFSRNNDQRGNRYDQERRMQNQYDNYGQRSSYDNYGQRSSSQQWNRQGVRIDAGTILNLLLRR